ncbi:hypothetical protein PWG71_18555 [Nocardiopsis sp. N85]|uniref:hypothetical protein n=1 Tax=Nocardiopsis sp. N85 TaxID=3029400 RepID=UPI00237F7519|nr:hypothetical protein [Nocardiopsis sp. N85]MDE3723399.1 hypothetical protein [Nocardiopsis sp. N85]
MRQSSAALLRAVFALFGALLSPSRGRHTRRRSTRVRRYAQNPRPATRPSPPAAPHLSESRLHPPREVFPAEELPLVRPYYTAHEQARVQARVQAEATARLHRWSAPRTPKAHAPEGRPAAPHTPETRPAGPLASAPRPPEPRLPEGDLLAPTPPPVTFEDLAALTRVWIAQQESKAAVVV